MIYNKTRSIEKLCILLEILRPPAICWNMLKCIFNVHEFNVIDRQGTQNGNCIMNVAIYTNLNTRSDSVEKYECSRAQTYLYKLPPLLKKYIEVGLLSFGFCVEPCVAYRI